MTAAFTPPFTPTSRHWADLSGPALTAALTERSIAVVPIGAIEHHGPHLPLRTDALVAETIATAAVERVAADGIDAWVLPTISYAKSAYAADLATVARELGGGS